MKQGYVYILTNKPNGTLYIGVSSDLARRIEAHKSSSIPGFTKRYNLCRLVYVEVFDDIQEARIREGQMKKWKRDWKLKLIEKMNPTWADLSCEIYR